MKTEKIETDRLILRPATQLQLQADISASGKLSRLLGAKVPGNWPPEIMRDALPVYFEFQEKHPESFGWLMWYCLFKHPHDNQPVAAGSVGFKGRPSADGTIEVGYSMLPQFWGKGIATEAVARLIKWAFQHPEVERVVAETRPANQASRRVLEKLNFSRTNEPANEPGHIRLVLEWIDFAKSDHYELA